MMYDEQFLEKLELQSEKTIYVKIISLTKDEREVETIEGTVSKGNLSIDGKSAIRRTCQLTMVTNEINLSNYLWSLHNKFKLFIGLENNLDDTYPSIIWFPQGVFVITTFSSALTQKSYTINISGKDKMCLLNGEVGGNFNSQIDFGKLEIASKENGEEFLKIIKLPIKKIIREMVHQYGNEPFHNIIINDLDETGLELLEYRFNDPLYVLRKYNDDIQNFTQGYLNKDMPVYFYERDKLVEAKISEGGLDKSEGVKFIYDPLIPSMNVKPTPIYLEKPEDEEEVLKNAYAIARIQHGETAGYRETEMVYPGDLIAKPGETITSILDKIKKVLNFYEYFYNVEGQFIFQKKNMTPPVTYSFEGSKLFTSFNNTPNLKEAKNDFTVWGQRITPGGANLPIHMRTAIQQKPKKYTSITVNDEELKSYNKAYGLKTIGQKGRTYSVEDYDWRELIYQMSLDYRKYNHLDDFELKVGKANPENYPTGITGYEQYYIDLEGFWRQLYTPESLQNTHPIEKSNLDPWLINGINANNSSQISIEPIDKNNSIFNIEKNNDYLNVIFSQPLKTESKTTYTISGYFKNNKPIEIYMTEKGKDHVYNEDFFWGKTFEMSNFKQCWNTNQKLLYINKKDLVAIIPPSDIWTYFTQEIKIDNEELQNELIFSSDDNFSMKAPSVLNSNYYNSTDIKKRYWNKDILENPSVLNFYFDLIEDGEVQQFSIEAIGNRPKVVNNDKIKAISYREVPWIIFGPVPENPKSGYRYFNTPNFDNAFSISYQSKSAADEIKYLMDKHSYCLESISVKAIPIFRLQPNDLISINDASTGINGNYTISKYSIALSHQATMSLTAVKDMNKIY